ncbi:hypothetical protein PLESTB_000625400 [Pleodorina starrii]|uniref:Uncharacterized protein n=1 Tax=Pleodorina starrii TaxID=330485 RepID=A0A9W6BIG1_9CHLO|nr:hypothetical protein PLESTB_000625400 [Pleodorina starrii]
MQRRRRLRRVTLRRRRLRLNFQSRPRFDARVVRPLLSSVPAVAAGGNDDNSPSADIAVANAASFDGGDGGVQKTQSPPPPPRGFAGPLPWYPSLDVYGCRISELGGWAVFNVSGESGDLLLLTTAAQQGTGGQAADDAATIAAGQQEVHGYNDKGPAKLLGRAPLPPPRSFAGPLPLYPSLDEYGGRISKFGGWMFNVSGESGDLLLLSTAAQQGTGGQVADGAIATAAGQQEGAVTMEDYVLAIPNGAESGCEEALEWLVERGCPFPLDGGAYFKAAFNGDLAMPRCLHRLG